jgi:hypothetical protein
MKAAHAGVAWYRVQEIRVAARIQIVAHFINFSYNDRQEGGELLVLCQVI